MPDRRVILVLPTQEALHDSAMMRLNGGGGISRRLTGLPARADIDTSFSAIPLGDSQSGSPVSVSSPDGASHYAVRATIDAAAEPAALPAAPVVAEAPALVTGSAEPTDAAPVPARPSPEGPEPGQAEGAGTTRASSDSPRPLEPNG